MHTLEMERLNAYFLKIWSEEEACQMKLYLRGEEYSRCTRFAIQTELGVDGCVWIV